MIVPLVSEKEWRAGLQDIPLWFPSNISTIIVAPHPDDETLGAGGLIRLLTRNNVEVTVVAVTDGEGAYGDFPGLATTRCQEQTEALGALGVAEDRIVRLGLPDRDVSGHEGQLVKLLGSMVKNECHVVAPWTGDFHPDHEACGRAAEHVALSAGSSLSFYFFWTWHRGTPEVVRGLTLKALPLDLDCLTAKSEAIRKHRSQLVHPSGKPILPHNLLEPTLWPFEVFATT